MTGTSDPNPYVGPRPIQQGEPLYGRSAEVKELFHLLQARRIVVLHSPSGAGKSSLVQAGLVPLLLQARFDVWRSIRVNLDPRNLGELPPHVNRYTLSAVLSLEEELPAERRRSAAVLAGMTLPQYIATRPRRKGKADQSVALLFDQFEEILTADPTAVEQKRAFFDQLGEVLENRLYWALLILREDYLGAFAPYREQIPTGMANSFRLDLLSLEAARMAAVEPALSANRTFPAADRLVHDLSTIMVQQPDGSFRAEAGLYVEPVQLQVVCRRLWAAMPPEDRVIGEADLARFADISRSLGAYYADAVRLAAGGDLGRERAIREWVGNQLIVGGIRSQVRREPERSGGLGNALIDALRESYLVRAEQRAGALWFELSHDRMVEPVQRDNADWEQEHLHPLQIQGKLWNGQGRPDSLLLGPTALTEALAWAAQNPSMVTPTEADFLARAKELREAEARQRARELRSARRQRWLSAILAVVGFFALIAMGISLWAYGQANQERKAADEQRANALEAQRKATDAAQSAKEAAAQAEQERAAAALAKGIAEDERAAADQARLDADAQRLLAIAALAKAREAEQEQRQALKETRRQAMLAHDTLAMLAVGELAPDAARSLPFLADVESPSEARGWTEAAALALLYPAPTWRLPGSSLERLGVKGGQIAAVGSDGRLVVVNPAGELSGRPAAPGGPGQEVPAFVQPSPDGAWVVYGGRQPQIVPSSGEVGNKLAVDGQSLWSADFDPSGNWLVGSLSDGTAALWKRVPAWGRRYQSQAIKAPSPVNIWKVQFSPDGQKWLAAGSDGQVILRDLAGTELARTPSTADIATYLQEKGPDSNELVGPHLCQMVGLVDAVFAPVGEKVLIVGSDQVQRVWDYQQGVCTQPAMQRVVKSAVWLPDGAHTVYLEETGELWLQPLAPNAGDMPQRLAIGGERLAVRDDGMIAVADKRGWISLLKLTGKDVVQSWVLPSPGAALKGMDFSSGGLVALYENGLRRWDPTRLSSPSRLVAPPQAEVPFQGRAEDGARGQVYYAENRKKDYDLGAATGLWWQVIGLQDHLSLPFPQQGGPDIQIPDALWRNSAEKTVLFARADGSVHLLPRWETTQWKEMVDLVGGCIPVDDRVLFYGETRSVAEKQLDLCQNPPASTKRAGGEGK